MLPQKKINMELKIFTVYCIMILNEALKMEV